MLSSLTSLQRSRAYSSSLSARSMDAASLSSACWTVCLIQRQRSHCWTWSCNARSCRYTSMQAATCGTRCTSCLTACHLWSDVDGTCQKHCVLAGAGFAVSLHSCQGSPTVQAPRPAGMLHGQLECAQHQAASCPNHRHALPALPGCNLPVWSPVLQYDSAFHASDMLQPQTRCLARSTQTSVAALELRAPSSSSAKRPHSCKRKLMRVWWGRTTPNSTALLQRPTLRQTGQCQILLETQRLLRPCVPLHPQ